jgi:hypothetical protein
LSGDEGSGVWGLVMNLDDDDLTHVHKVLTTDTKECHIFLRGKTGGERVRLEKRIEENKRVIGRIERILGSRLIWS